MINFFVFHFIPIHCKLTHFISICYILFYYYSFYTNQLTFFNLIFFLFSNSLLINFYSATFFSDFSFFRMLVTFQLYLSFASGHFLNSCMLSELLKRCRTSRPRVQSWYTAKWPVSKVHLGKQPDYSVEIFMSPRNFST